MSEVKKIKELFVGGRQFKKEFKDQVRLFLIITLGFTIAFTWRQTVFDACQSFIQRFITTNGPTVLSILTSLFITIIALILIYLASKFLSTLPDY